MGNQHDGAQQAQVVPRSGPFSSKHQRIAQRKATARTERLGGGRQEAFIQRLHVGTSTPTAFISRPNIQQLKSEHHEPANQASARAVRWAQLSARIKRSASRRTASCAPTMEQRGAIVECMQERGFVRWLCLLLNTGFLLACIGGIYVLVQSSLHLRLYKSLRSRFGANSFSITLSFLIVGACQHDCFYSSMLSQKPSLCYGAQSYAIPRIYIMLQIRLRFQHLTPR
jgi:hypothetical protein